MLIKDYLEEFLFLYSKADIIPFTNYEDDLVSNFNALDCPFPDYYNSTIGWIDYLKIEISENLLLQPVNKSLLYLNYVQDKLKFESIKFDYKNLIDLFKYYQLDVEILDFNKNKKLKEVLNNSFKNVSGFENLNKLKFLHREYYKYLLNIEINKILKYVNELIQGLDIKNATEEKFKKQIWFKVGLLFASGEMEEFYDVNDKNETVFKVGFNALKVARELKFDNYNKYILATINNYRIKNSKGEKNNSGNKNIFNSREKMTLIISYCNDNKIDVIPYFLERLPPE